MLLFSHHSDFAFRGANSFPAPSQFSYATANERGYVSASNSAYCSSTPLPQEVHQTTNDGFSGHSSGHVDWPSAPSQALRSPYHPTEEALLNTHFDSPDWSSAPSQTFHGSHQFTGKGLPLYLDSFGADVFILLCLLHDVATHFCLSAQFLSWCSSIHLYSLF